MMKLRRSSHGITIVEVMVALAVLGIILALSAPSLADLLNRRRVQAVAEQISSDMAFLRAETILRQQEVFAYFQQDGRNSCYTMAYAGTLGNCQCAVRSGEASVCNGNRTELKTSTVPSSTGVRFAPVPENRGATFTTFSFKTPQLTASTPSFAISVEGTRGATLQVKINALGRVLICTPNASMPGAAPC